MTPGRGSLLEVDDLTVEFPGARPAGSLRRSVVRAVDHVSLHVDRGETLGIVGESGSGKSTTARAIIQLVKASSGSIRFEGVDVTSADRGQRRHLRSRVEMVFQDPFASLNSRMRVGEVIREPLDIHRVGDRASRRRRVAELLDLVGLPSSAVDRFPHEFSGGQRQRIGIARALAVDPALVICDEPVAALDVSIQAQILQLLKDLQREIGMAYLFIAHDLNVVRHMSHRTSVMYLGRIVEQGPSEPLFRAPAHPYTRALVSAIPAIDPSPGSGRILLKGEIPSPTNPPSGCRFRTRCPFAQGRCAAEVPPLRPGLGGVNVACHFWEQIAESDADAASAS